MKVLKDCQAQLRTWLNQKTQIYGYMICVIFHQEYM